MHLIECGVDVVGKLHFDNGSSAVRDIAQREARNALLRDGSIKNPALAYTCDT